MCKSVTSVKVYFRGDTETHKCFTLNGADDFSIDPDTKVLSVIANGEVAVVFDSGEWKQAHKIRTCDSCGK